MKLSTRESVLGVATLAVALGALTWWGGGAKMKAWQDLGKTREALRTKMTIAERLVARRPQVEARLQELLKDLPRHPPEKDVTAELLKTLETTASENDLTLTRREPEKERAAGELYEVAINCNWEGSLEALTRFLFAIQSRGAVIDVRQLTISPSRSGGHGLSGNFTVACAYTRTRPAPAAAPAAAATHPTTGTQTSSPAIPARRER